MNEFKTKLTHYCDQWQAYCRDWIEKQGDEEMIKFTKNVMDRTKAGDLWASITAYFTLVGILSAWIQVEEKSDGEQPDNGGVSE